MGPNLGRPGILAQTATAFPAAASILVAAASFPVATSASAVAQEQPEAAPETRCEEGVVSSIIVDNRPVFDTAELPEGSRLGPLYRFGNALHVTTRPSFVRRELLLSEGECFDSELMAESGRILRNYGFFDDAHLTVEQAPDGSRVVSVTTRDQWTTKFDLGLALDQGLQLERLQLAEENLLGRGLLAQVFMRLRREQRDFGFQVGEPRLLGTRADASFTWGRSRVGRFLTEAITYPFVGETGRWAFRQSISSEDEVFSYSTGESAGVTHVLLPMEIDAAELSLATRLGRPGALTLLGIGASHHRLAASDYEGGVEVVHDSDFNESSAAPDGVRTAILERLAPYATTRINFMLGRRNLRFERVSGLDALRGEQDVGLGVDAGLTVGRSLGSWPADGYRPDTFLKLGLASGWRLRDSYFFLNAAAEGRRVVDQDGGGPAAEWIDSFGEVDLLAYLRASASSRATFLLRAAASGGRAREVPFQLTLGGRDGVRGYREEAFPGSERVLLTAESRLGFGWPLPHYVDTGITLFADAGRIWSGDVPFGTDSDWRSSLGFGLRFGFPAGTPRAARIDVAFPLGGGSPVLRITMRELLGVGAGTSDAQLERSRIGRLGPERFIAG